MWPAASCRALANGGESLAVSLLDTVGIMELIRNLKLDEVARLKPTPPHAVAPDATIGDAVRLMRSKHVGCLLVCDGKKLVGIITERDLLTRVLAIGRPLSDTVDAVMTADPRTVGSRDPIRRALA